MYHAMCNNVDYAENYDNSMYNSMAVNISNNYSNNLIRSPLYEPLLIPVIYYRLTFHTHKYFDNFLSILLSHIHKHTQSLPFQYINRM